MLSKYIVPIIPDESRTFGMEGMFRQLGICTRWTDVHAEDADQLMFYKESKTARCCRKAQRGWRDVRLDGCGDVVLDARRQMIPFYIFYSMFGFQRVGDFTWAAPTCARGDSCWAALRDALP